MSKVSIAGQLSLKSNLQLAAAARNLALANGERDFGKRQFGENAKMEDALVGDFDATRELTQERPHHRTMVNMAMAGYNHKEIADFTGYSAITVANTLKQPWARERLIKKSMQTVQEEIREFLEGEVLPSLKTLRSVRDDMETPKAVKVVASNSILDRYLGKPVQPISGDQKPPSELSDDDLRKQVEREITASTTN